MKSSVWSSGVSLSAGVNPAEPVPPRPEVSVLPDPLDVPEAFETSLSISAASFEMLCGFSSAIAVFTLFLLFKALYFVKSILCQSSFCSKISSIPELPETVTSFAIKHASPKLFVISSSVFPETPETMLFLLSALKSLKYSAGLTSSEKPHSVKNASSPLLKNMALAKARPYDSVPPFAALSQSETIVFFSSSESSANLSASPVRISTFLTVKS